MSVSPPPESRPSASASRAAATLPAADAATLFEARFGRAAEQVWSAAARVNLIGEHTDHQLGLVLPFAIDYRAAVAVSRNDDGVLRVCSAQVRDRVHTATDLAPGTASATGWQAYVFGVVWALRRRGADIPGVDIALSSDIPSGAGLSSSAAVECATGLAISGLFGLELSAEEIARIAQHAENDFVGMPCGLMDQMASAASRAGHALFFDVGADIIEHIPFDPAAGDLDVVVIDTRAHHSLADGEYAKHRADCDAAAAQLGVPALSAVRIGGLDEALARLTGPRADLLRRRVRHVVTENQRVREVVALLRARRLAEIGAALSASHASLRDDFEVSCAELDVAAESAERAGALGARMVGAGFGGSVIALVPRAARAAVEAGVTAAFAESGFRAPLIRAVAPHIGGRRDA